MEKFVERIHYFRNKNVEIAIDKVQKPSGRQTTRIAINHPETVAILPLLGKNVILVKQYRYPIKKDTIELPAGKINNGESIIDAAKRELEEETGYTSNSFTKIYSFYPNAGGSNEICHLFLTSNLVKTEKMVDTDEISSIQIVDFKSLQEKIHKNEIDDPLILLAMNSKITLDIINDLESEIWAW